MTRWCKRAGSRGSETLLKEAIETALSINCIKQKDLLKVTIDTTVQEKNITFPTDVKLYAKGTEILVRESKKLGIKLRQTYTRTVPMLERANWLKNHDRKYKQANACQNDLKQYLAELFGASQEKQPRNNY
jgi:IS5 family transposase